MSGVYILVTKDGFRVNYSDRYDDFFDGFSDEICNYLPNPYAIRLCFGESRCFGTKQEAISNARLISASLSCEKSDGIMFIQNFETYTFEELINE